MQRQAVPATEVTSEVSLLDQILSQPVGREADETETLKARIAELESRLAKPVTTEAPKMRPRRPRGSWKGDPVTNKQRMFLKHLRNVMLERGLSIRGTKTPATKGAASEMIRNLQTAVRTGTAAVAAGYKKGTRYCVTCGKTRCNIGPFAYR